MPTPSWTVSFTMPTASNSPAKACAGHEANRTRRLDQPPSPVTQIHRPARLATRAASFRYGGRHHSGIPGDIIPLYPGDFVGIRKQDGRQQLRADEAARRGMERRGRLADPLAIAAGELFPHRLDDLEATWDLLQRLGHILADLRQPRSAAAGAGRRSLDNDALVFDVVRPGLAYRSLAREGADFLRLRRRGLRGKLILARRGDEFFELQFQLLDQPRRALGALPVQFAFELLDPQLEMRDQRLVVRQLCPRVGGIRDGHIAFSLQRLTLGQQRHVGAREVRRKIVRLRCHEAIESDQAADSIVKSLSNSRWTPCFLRVAPVDSR